jgi:positive regulator of sigma E activity
VKSFLSSAPVLWFLFLFNLAVSGAAAVVLDGTQQIFVSVCMAVVSLGAGVSLLRRHRTKQA